MSQDTTLRQLEDLVRRFCEERDWDQFHDAKDLAIGVSTEAAELLECFRFRSPHEIEEMLRNPRANIGVAEEISDVLYFLLRLAQKYGIDLADAFKKKMKLNESRYPIPTSKGSNKKYTEL